MSLIQEHFRLAYEILTIGSIKPWGETKIDGNVYPPSVKFRATNIENKDSDVGLREVETIVDFQVTTTNMAEAMLLTEKIRKLRSEKKSLHLIGGLPNKEKADEILKIKSTEPLEDFLKRNGISLSVPKEKA